MLQSLDRDLHCILKHVLLQVIKSLKPDNTDNFSPK